MPDRTRLSRRSLLKRAGLISGALVLGGAAVLDRTLWRDDPVPGYLSGFNDDFVAYSTSSAAASVLPDLKAAGGRCIRIGVDWGRVQADGPDSWDWSYLDPIQIQCLAAGVEILPTVFGCPEWAGPVVTASRRAVKGSPYPDDSFRTCSPEFDGEFGRFADATLRRLDAPRKLAEVPRLVSAVEILNEPNFWIFGDVPADRLRELTTAAAEAVNTSEQAGAFSNPMRVLSGGLAPLSSIAAGEKSAFPPRPSWQDYLSELTSAGPLGFDIGVHSYELGKPPAGEVTAPESNPTDPYARAREFATWQTGRIVERVDEALALTSRDIWLTETGASSASTWPEDVFTPEYRLAHGEEIQAEVLSGVADALKSRPRCRSMIVHRLYSDDEAEPPPNQGSGFSSDYFQYGVYDAIDGAPKLAVAALAEAWG